MDNAKSHDGINAIVDTRNLVTAVKLKQLYTKKKECEDHYLPILARVEAASTEKEKLKILIEEYKKKGGYFDHNSNALDLLAMAEHDLSMTDEVFKAQRVEAEENIRKILRKAQYTSLFGSIFNEWMNFEGKSDAPEDEKDGVKTPKSDDESTIDIFTGGRPEKFAQKAELESIIFAPDPKAKPEEFLKYLGELFKQVEEDVAKQKAAKKSAGRSSTSIVIEEDDDDDEDDDSDDDDDAEDEEDADDRSSSSNSSEESDDEYLEDWGNAFSLSRLRNTLGRFSGTLRKHDELGRVDVKQAIHGLVSGELLTEAKKAACKEILLSEVILDEIAMVLTLRLREIENWKWSEDSIQLNFRRHLNGKYRCYADEPLLDAIFLQWIGVKWGMELRRVFGIVHRSAAWMRPEDPIDEARNEVRTLMLESEKAKKPDSIIVREKLFLKEFFLTVLPESLYDFRTYAEDGEEADQEKKDNEKIRRARNEELKQMLLQRLLIDRQYAEAVNPDRPFTVVQVDAYRFAQSQSHEVILGLMKFIGVNDFWIKFFETFLRLPARFEAGGEVRESKRGVPISHPLGLVFGEVQLFLMEFAVNRATKGNLDLFRMHDDLWWWSDDEKLCETAWETIKEYSALTGTDWNLDKSGCVRITNKPGDASPPPSTLPTGDICWGFIKLNSEGIWKIKQDEVIKHTEELRLQLSSQKSILGTIAAYNRYMKFFVRNFAKPAIAFGKQHVDQIISALTSIHTSLFPSHNGDVLSFITSLINSRFSDELPPDGIIPAWLLMPVANGGLGLRNVLFDLYPIIKAYTDGEENSSHNKPFGYYSKPANFKECLKKDKLEYERLRENWLKAAKPPKVVWNHDAISDDWFENMDEYLASQENSSKNSRRRRKPHPFITYQEFILGRRTRFGWWGDVFGGLSETPSNFGRYSFPEKIKEGLKSTSFSAVEWLKKDYATNTPYWKSWLLAGFGEQVLDTFGEFQITNDGRLPVAMIDIYTNLKTKWDQ